MPSNKANSRRSAAQPQVVVSERTVAHHVDSIFGKPFELALGATLDRSPPVAPEQTAASHDGIPTLEVGLCTSQPITRSYDFGISFSTTWSMLKLAALARGGNSLKLSSHFASIGGAAYCR